GRLMANMNQGGLQARASLFARAGNETCGVVTCIQHQLVVVEGGGQVGGAFHGIHQRSAEGVGGSDETGCRGGAGQQGDGGGGDKQESEQGLSSTARQAKGHAG